MRYVKLGSTGLDVSRICLGCMSFGLPDRGRTAEVALDAASGRHIRVNLVGDEPVIDVDPDPPRFA